MQHIPTHSEGDLFVDIVSKPTDDKSSLSSIRVTHEGKMQHWVYISINPQVVSSTQKASVSPLVWFTKYIYHWGI